MSWIWASAAAALPNCRRKLYNWGGLKDKTKHTNSSSRCSSHPTGTMALVFSVPTIKHQRVLLFCSRKAPETPNRIQTSSELSSMTTHTSITRIASSAPPGISPVNTALCTKLNLTYPCNPAYSEQLPLHSGLTLCTFRALLEKHNKDSHSLRTPLYLKQGSFSDTLHFFFFQENSMKEMLLSKTRCCI